MHFIRAVMTLLHTARDNCHYTSSATKPALCQLLVIAVGVTPFQIAILWSRLERLDRSHAFEDRRTLILSHLLCPRLRSKKDPNFPRPRPLTLPFYPALSNRGYLLTHLTIVTLPISRSRLVANTKTMLTPNDHEPFFVVPIPTSIPTLR